MDDTSIRQFMDDLEVGIREANRTILHERIPNISRDQILRFAVEIARLRGHYLEAAFRLSSGNDGGPPDDSDIKNLRHKREIYEETVTAFEALRYAVERGYLDLDANPKKQT